MSAACHAEAQEPVSRSHSPDGVVAGACGFLAAHGRWSRGMDLGRITNGRT
jgi:hypothetical protein